MIAINASLCSKEFNRALDAVLKEGKSIRRASWPTGMHLEYTAKRSIYVVRPDVGGFPTWAGPSGDEMDATDWEVIGGETQMSLREMMVDFIVGSDYGPLTAAEMKDWTDDQVFEEFKHGCYREGQDSVKCY